MCLSFVYLYLFFNKKHRVMDKHDPTGSICPGRGLRCGGCLLPSPSSFE